MKKRKRKQNLNNDDWNEPRFDSAAVTIRTDIVTVTIYLAIYQAPCQVPSTHIYFVLYNNLLSRIFIPIFKMRKLRLAEVKLHVQFTQMKVKGRHPNPGTCLSSHLTHLLTTSFFVL